MPGDGVPMSDPLLSGPVWVASDLGTGEVANAIVDLGSPRASPEVPGIMLYLQIEEDGEDLFWSIGIGEEVAGFGEATIESGTAEGLPAAKVACWAATVAYLRDDGYGDDEIAMAVPHPARSLTLDLDDDCDE